MAKIFLGIAAAVMLATAALGFLLQGKVKTLSGSVKDAKSSVATAERKAATAKETADRAAKDLAEATAKSEEREKEFAAQKTQIDDLRRERDEAATALAAKTKEAADLQVRVAALPSATGTPTAPDDSAALIELRNQLQKAQTEVSEARQIQDTLNNRVKETESRLATSELKEKQRQAQFVRAGLSGRILAVNAGWNFVVLSIGDRQGVIVNAPLLVTRDGDQIARARITSVEPATSIADVIPSSVRKGVSIQPGDTVIFEGRSMPGAAAPGGVIPAGPIGAAALPAR